MARQRAATRTVDAFAERFEAVVANVERVIQGKDEAIRLALVCLVAEGHLLIEDVPGVGKTSLAKSIAASFDCTWHRIQFTPDLLPSDVTGTTVWHRGRDEFEFRAGGIFANIVLADELNRASPKTQSALLEAMEERQVTVDATTYVLDTPFMVIATQNPQEHEGTYPLPDSQLDRFLMRIGMGYPDRSAEVAMLDAHESVSPVDELEPVASALDARKMADIARAVHVAPSIKGYVVDVAAATRRHPALSLGVSPRGALALMRAARAFAASVGREYVVPDDVKGLAPAVLAHRLALGSDAQLGGEAQEAILDEVLASVPVPTGRGT